MDEQPGGQADSGEGRLVYLVENLASLHAAQNMGWIASRFEFLGEKAIGAALTVLAISDDSGVYRAATSASQRPAMAGDWWDDLKIDELAQHTAAEAAFGAAEGRGRAAVYEIKELFPDCAREGAERAIVAPVSFNREMLGVGLFIVEPNELTEAMTSMLSSHAAVAIHQLRQRDEARRLHSLDQRLWVPDQSYLMTQLTREIARARRYGREVGVAMLRFASEPAVRATYGDFYANHVMRRIGSQLLIDVRDSDIVGALNGGYAIIHTETRLEGTQASSERLRDKVIGMLSQRFPELTDLEIDVSAAAYPASGATVEEVVGALTASEGDVAANIAA